MASVENFKSSQLGYLPKKKFIFLLNTDLPA